MKNLILKNIRALLVMAVFAIGSVAMSAQNSLPAPGSGGGYTPNTGGGGFGGPGFGGGPGMGMGPAWNPGPPTPAYWGSPWYTGYNYSPTIVVSPSSTTNNFQKQGIEKVIACGYDATGVWRVLPLVVSYQWDVNEYNVNVLNAWNPWTEEWDKGVDVQAYNTSYSLKNITYDFYVVLSYGTFYFNL